MNIVKWAFVVAIMCVSALAFGRNVEGISLSHYEALQRLDLQENRTAASAKLLAGGPATMRFDALGRSFELELEENTRLLSRAARAAMQENISLYRGQLAGNTKSWARITLAHGVPRGLIWDGSQMYAIETPADSVVSVTAPVIYRLADALIAPGAMSCGGAVPSETGADAFKSLVRELQAAKPQGPGAVSGIDFGAVADFEFTGELGNGADTEILTRLNNVDGIFSQQLGVQFNVQTVTTFATANDPFTDTANPGELLNELANYRQNTPAQRDQGLTHLFTGRNLDTTTVGIAFSGELCEPRFGAGLTQATHGPTFDSLIAAHEIGHNFGAPHDGVPGSVCEAEPSTFLMATQVNNNDQFSACSIEQMQDDIAGAVCITPLPAVDVGILSTAQPEPVLLGNAVTVGFDVSNLGTTTAFNVAVDVALPGDFSFLSSAMINGSCINGAGTVNCLLDTLAAGSGSTVIVTTRASAAGAGVFSASVSAEGDANPGNNHDSVQVIVGPAVNLSITQPAAAQVNVDQSTTVSVVLDNQTAQDATGVTLSISLDSGLRADSASWSIGSCNVAAGQVDCQSDNFAGLTSSSIDLGISGTMTGQLNYLLTLASSEADSDPSDNSLSGTITVNSVSGGGNGNGTGDEQSGAGTAGPFSLWILGLLALVRRRQSNC